MNLKNEALDLTTVGMPTASVCGTQVHIQMQRMHVYASVEAMCSSRFICDNHVEQVLSASLSQDPLSDQCNTS